MAARGVKGPVIAVTGTPGTGKTSACAHLASRGHPVLSLARYRDDPRFDLGADTAREHTHIMDEEAIDHHLATHLADEATPRPSGSDPVFVEGHLAHLLRVADRVIILRCSPRVLRERLKARGWSEGKIGENLEAEGMDLILQEAVAAREEAKRRRAELPLGELDTTSIDPSAVADRLLALATEDPVNLEIGRLDWSDEVLGWY